MSPIDKFVARVDKHIDEVIAAFVDGARRIGIAPVDLASTDVWVVADTSSAVVREFVRHGDPDPSRGPGEVIMFATDRARLIDRRDAAADPPGGLRVVRSPPPRGWFVLVCVSESEDGRLREEYSLVALHGGLQPTPAAGSRRSS